MKQAAAKKMKQRSAGKPDIELGKRIRLRRVEQKISQAELGDKLGVSFQQVQKYEKGVNRVGAARLQQIATAIDCGRARHPDIENAERYTPLARRSVEWGDFGRGVESQQREFRPHGVVE